MKTADFNFELPPRLIAQHPSKQRGESRLMMLDRAAKNREHRTMRDLPSLLDPGTLMVFNNSRVRRTRLSGIAELSGKEHEFLLLKRLDACCWQVMVKRAARMKVGARFRFADTVCAEIVSNSLGEGMASLCFSRPIDDAWLDVHGHIPLPPYIRRADSEADSDRYQTVYAQAHGSSAAPTAGLHFTQALLGELASIGIESAFITLHVGLGTFLPVRSETIEQHTMHEESYHIDEETASRIEGAKNSGRKILAVGTTSVRTLESAWADGKLKRGEGSTSIFIYPPYTFNVVDALFTNFHTPESTLLMLVSAFAGKDFILESYAEAVRENYRFFSYGDAMLIH